MVTSRFQQYKQFTAENNKNIGWWYVGYGVTLGIMPLINSFAPSFVKEQKTRLETVVDSAIDDCKELLRKELQPQLQEQIKQILEIKKTNTGRKAK